MKNTQPRYQIYVDESDAPAMFGVVCRDGPMVSRLSTDYAEVERLVDALNRNRLSPEHFWDVIEDFRHS